MNRADLAWALNAVLPHCGKTELTNRVGIERFGALTYVYATDEYTIGIARLDGISLGPQSLTKAETTELLRFVRPGLKAEHEQELAFGTREGELHVGFDDETEVFDTLAPGSITLSYLLRTIDRIESNPFDWQEAIYQPKVLERFAKAQRSETDRLRIFPRRVSDRNGVAVVTVGESFIGAISGLTYDQAGTDTVSGLLTERKVA